MSAACPPDLVDLAGRLADAAAAIVRPRFRVPIAVDIKSDASPVTEADREAELAMRRLIETERPDHGVQGEEFGDRDGVGEWHWILDPIDGTKSFVTGSTMFGTLIALTHRGEAALGLLDQPITNERWLAHGDTPTTLNGNPVQSRACGQLSEAVVFTSGLEYYRSDDKRAAFDRLYDATRFTRFSGDCYAVGLLAMGFVDIVIEGAMHVHDFAALVPIVENAGGRISDWQGRPLDMQNPSEVIAVGDPALHEAVIDMLAG